MDANWNPAVQERLARHLIGDPLREVTIPKWVDDKLAAIGGTLPNWQDHFELGCAYLHDARPALAMERFQLLAAPVANHAYVLALVGLGRAAAALRRYSFADQALVEATHKAAQFGDGAALALARYAYTANRSDGGMSCSPNEVSQPAALGPESALRLPLEAFRVLALSRILLRLGAREEGIRAIDYIIADPGYSLLPPIARTQLARMRGILFAMLGQTTEALQSLEDASGIARQCGYQIGEVQSALSLAKIHVRTDRINTGRYLRRAEDLVAAADPPDAPHPRGRQMIAEAAILHGRLGDFHFANGDLDDARNSYERDLALTLSQSDASTPLRALGYSYRNVGRVLLAQRRFVEASQNLLRSAQVFREVGDVMNIFFSEALLCEALLNDERYEEAAATIASMEQSLADRQDRDKERGFAQVLTGLLAWRSNRAFHALTTILAAKLKLSEYGNDYYYTRALLAEAEIRISQKDNRVARDRLLEARKCALDFEQEDLRREAEDALGRIGVPRSAFNPLTDLEIRCAEKSTRVELTILFGDLRGFTQLCTVIPPPTMAEFIREFAEVIGRAISRNGGLATRFLGDCVMALFGVRNDPEHREVKCAAAVVDAYTLFSLLRKRWGAIVPELGSVGIGFGAATGPVVAGRFGTAERSEFSVVGEAANLASRLQGHANDGDFALCPATAAVLQTRLAGMTLTEQEVALKGLGKSTLRIAKVEAVARCIKAQRARPEPRVVAGEITGIHTVASLLAQAAGGVVK
jgi:class 3 adenylate cyclase